MIMETLHESLENKRAKTGGYTSSDQMQIKLADDKYRSSEIPEVGDKALPFSLPGENQEEVSLADLVKKGPVILNFFRGNFCEYCRLELKALERSLSHFQQYHATLVGISPSLVSIKTLTKDPDEISYAVLSDVGNKVANMYGLSYKMSNELVSIFEGFGMDLEDELGTTNDEGHNLSIPATFVVNQEMEIVFGFTDSDHTKRAEPSEIVACLMTLV